MAAIWSKEDLKSMKAFCKQAQLLQPKEALLIEYRPKDISEELVNGFKRTFNWHYDDTQRSYTQKTLRKHGNRGKKEDFAYFNRAVEYFGYDQFMAHYRKPNSLICLWNPGKKGDMFGEHKPCLVTVKFIQRQDKLDMVATFRKRDVCRRMIGNMVFLSLWLNQFAEKYNLTPGKIVDFSMETQWDPNDIKCLMAGLGGVKELK